MPVILLAGASRGLGLGLAAEFVSRSWQVIATARDVGSGPLADLAHAHPNQLRVLKLDLDRDEDTASLCIALRGTRLDALFVVAGISLSPRAPLHEVPLADIARELHTNAVAPVRFAEAMLAVAKPQVAVAFMTSRLGSLALSSGGNEVYRASKAALNMLAKGFSVRHPERPVLLVHPGWVRTDMGGEGAPLDVETSARGMADLIVGGGEPGVRFLDYQGRTIPW